MKNIAKELVEFKNALSINASADWSDSDPSTEFSTLATNLQLIINKLSLSEREEVCERLSHLICDDEDNYASMDEALKLLQAQAEIDGSVMADNIVQMWEKVEYKFTVAELIEEIGL